MKIKKIKVIFLTTLLLISIVIIINGCGGTKSTENGDGLIQSESAESITLKLGHMAPSESVINNTTTAFKREVENKTNGKVKMQIFEGRQLGDMREMTEQIKMGTLEMGVISTPYFTSYERGFNVLDLPFLFQDNEQAYKNLDGKLGDTLA